MKQAVTIALDIDGTLIEKHLPVSINVQNYINSLHARGYKLLFITGRTYHFAKKTLHLFNFDYLLTVQNGAEILSMPDHKIFHQEFIPRSTIEIVEEALVGIESDLLVYSGYERGDFCYYRPSGFSKKALEYLDFLKTLTPIDWIALDNFDCIEQERFPLIKCVGPYRDMQLVKERLDEKTDLRACLINDRMSDFSILLITHKGATKGRAIVKLKELNQIKSHVIAAGDDMNDLPMFEVADVCIAMQDGAEGLKSHADIIAPCASQDGIIEGIEAALKKLS